MGKRKHKSDSRKHIKKKIRRLNARLVERDHHDSASSEENEYSRVQFTQRRGGHSSDLYVISDSDQSDRYVGLRSSVVVPPANSELPVAEHELPVDQPQVPDATEPSCSSAPVEALSTVPEISPDILAALGAAKGKSEVLGPPIQEQVSELWGRILTEGLDKDLKLKLMDKVLVPENFQLVKAPKLNPEISAVLTDSARNRDKRLEKAQQHLGLGIAEIANTVSLLIKTELDKVELIKKLSEINQILLDLHFENTVNRSKLIIPSLDKKFMNITQDIKRDKFLFGEGLGERIKASKTAEKSGLQVKRSDPKDISSKRYIPQQGNLRGPPRQAQRGGKQMGAKHRPAYQGARKYGQPNRYSAPTKSAFKTQSNKTQ